MAADEEVPVHPQAVADATQPLALSQVEIASDGPGFGVDEPMDRLGEKLVLPPFLEARRTQIEAGLKAI